MRGRQNIPSDSLFLYNIYLEDRVRKDHPLRRIKELIDFDFIYIRINMVKLLMYRYHLMLYSSSCFFFSSTMSAQRGNSWKPYPKG